MANRRNIEIPKGADYFLSLVCKDADGLPVDLAGHQVEAEVWRNDDELILDLTPTIIDPAGDGVLSGIYSAVPWAQTVELPLGAFRWDLILITPEGSRRRIVFGTATVIRVQTRP